MTEDLFPPSSSADRTKVVLMIAVWGSTFIQRFLDLSLRSLLAPGNIPALAEACDCTFLFLTHLSDRDTFESHEIFPVVSSCCATEPLDIGDITLPGNYSTTVTLAYERGMRSRGAEMTRTYFIYLVADYIMADGSLRSLIPHMRQGVSGITAGNFQIIAEQTESALKAQIDPGTHVLSIPPRALVRFALWHLHPVTVGNMADNPVCHTRHCNRLFWRVGDHALIGRFYLRHMVCIRPETETFVVGASCDYSFIPEMCPSGRVAALADSDEYCVVELQPLAHEQQFVAPGPFALAPLAKHLAQWTTIEHRRNAATPVVYHTDAVTPDVTQKVAESARVVEAVAALLPATCQPHRGHPYWRGAVTAASEYRERHHRFGDLTAFTLHDPLHCGDTSWRSLPLYFLRNAYVRCFGQSPDVYPWHPHWHDTRLLLPALKETARHGARRLLVVTAQPNPFTDWLAHRMSPSWTFCTLSHFLQRDRESVREEERVTQCFVFLGISELSCLPHLMPALRAHMEQDGEILLHLMSGLRNIKPYSLQEALGTYANDLLLPGLQLERVRFAESGVRIHLNYLVHRAIVRLGSNPDKARLGLFVPYIAGLFAGVFVDNLARLVVPSNGGAATSGVITIRVHHHEQSSHTGKAVPTAA